LQPKHKKWIDKKHSKTYRLIPQINESGGECAQKSVQEKDVEEHDRCGIYFNDDYNYLKHLKSVNEAAKSTMERTVIKVPPRKTNLSENVFEANGYEISVELLKQGILPAEMHIDPEIISEITDDEFENPTNDLEDDFVLQASGGEIPSLEPPVPFPSKKNEFREVRLENEFESDDRSESEEILAVAITTEIKCSFLEDFSDHNEQVLKEDSFVPIESKKKLRYIDEQFEKMCEEYSEADSEANEDENDGMLDPNSDHIKTLAKEFKNKKIELVLFVNERTLEENDVVARRYAEIYDEDEEVEEELERVAITCSDKKKAKWDCETIVSTYSNIYNRPTVIADSSHKRRLKPVLREIDVNFQFNLICESIISIPYGMQKMDETQTEVSKTSVSTRRTRGETTEERKNRKSVIKLIRAERRAEKKCNKLAFKEERKKLAASRSKLPIKTLPIL
uniref:Protein LTV1 homolog n=1 Tax=Thelazia callipaeda TaxID=103827 RepID=A0A0N5CZE3_THECL